MYNKLTSAQNPKIKSLLHLRDKKERDQTGLFIVEGYREIRRAVDSGVRFESLYICPELFLGTNEESLIGQIKAPIFELPDFLFHKISYRDRPDGLVGVAHQMKTKLSDLYSGRSENVNLEDAKVPGLDDLKSIHIANIDRLKIVQSRELSLSSKSHFQSGRSIKKKSPALYVIAESIEKPGNLGTILRSSDATGADGVIVCDRCTDIYNPNVVRASVGTLFTLPVVEATSDEVLEWLKTNHIQIVAATPSADVNFTEVDLSGDVAIAVGTEQLGLTQKWMESADIRVKIPMEGVADSLNVAMATTLLLYEALRQRQHLTVR